MRKRRQRLSLFMWWNVGRHKEDARKLAAFARGPPQRKMPAMNGIEGTAEKANIHAPIVSSFAGPLGKLNVKEPGSDPPGTSRASGGIVRWSMVALSVWT